MNEQLQISEHDEIALLLPWYVNSSLSSQEHARVDQHVARCNACQENVSVLATVQSSLQHSAPTPIVPEPRVDDLLSNLDARDRHNDKRRWMPALSLAASIAALALATALLLTDQENTGKSAGWFETATSSGQISAMDYVLAVRFETTTLPADQQRVLQNIQARDISGEDEIGSYRVIVRMPASSLEELDRYALNIEALPEVQSVQIIAVHLPMRLDQ